MRTLQFTAQCAEHQQTDHIQDECRIAQEYVTDLLSKRLVQHGFGPAVMSLIKLR